MVLISSLFLGFLSGLMISLILGLVITPSWNEGYNTNFMLLTVWGGMLCTGWTLVSLKNTSDVWARGSLIGAAEWLAFGIGTIFLSGTVVSEFWGSSMSTAELVGAGIGAYLFSALGMGFAIFMTLVCLLTWFIANKMRVEFQPEVKRWECPQCGEHIAKAAKKCRFCGIEISSKEKALAAISG